MRDWRLALLAAALFLGVLVAYLKSPVVTSGDSMLALYVAHSALYDGNVDLNEFAIAAEAPEYMTDVIDGHRRWLFSLGTPLLAAPLLWVFEQVPTLDAHFRVSEMETRRPLEAEHFLASLFAAIAVLFVFLFSQRIAGTRAGVVLALLFAFGTPAYSTASRALWQHGPSILMIGIVLYLLVLAREKPWVAALAGVPMAAAWVVRPANAFALALVSAYVLWRHRRQLAGYAAGMAVVLAPLFVYHLKTYGALLPPYYTTARYGAGVTVGSLLDGAAGTLVSPSRGLFVFSSFLIFGVVGIVLARQRKRLEPLQILAAVVFLVHWAMVASFPQWWGGSCFGPRYFTDVVPFSMLLLAYSFREVLASETARRTAISLAVALAATGGLSVWIHWRGSTDYALYDWSGYAPDRETPRDIDAYPERLWDWSDPQFLR
jgi:hypothetical protein